MEMRRVQVVKLGFWTVVAITALFLPGGPTANAKKTVALVFSREPAASDKECKPIYDPNWPGLQECTVKIDVDTMVASQKMSLWCWAASLSMIYTLEGHPISQENIVLQNFGSLVNAPGGDFLTFEGRLNRKYKDDNGDYFNSRSTRILTPAQAKEALENDLPMLYSMTHHATVQTAMTYLEMPGGPVKFVGGRIWDPEPGAGWHKMNAGEVKTFVAAWSIKTH